MPKRVEISTRQIDWLREAVRTNKSISAMAAYIGCHPDTLRRKLNRLGLAQFTGAKFLPPVGFHVRMWTRPCSGCGSKKPRPRMTFYCESCAEKRGFENGTDPYDW